MPLVSVIITTYNAAHYVKAAIDSVLAQTFTDFEILVIDDGSKDDTRDLVNQYGAAARYFYQENSGVSVARNNGIAQSAGRYVAFLDVDDKWAPEKLERQLAALQLNSAASACHTAHLLVDDNLQPLGVHHYQRSASSLEDLLLRGNQVGTPSSVMVEKCWFEKTGGFDLKLSHSADWDMWIRLSQHIDFAYVDEPLLQYRWHDNNMSHNAPLYESDTLLALTKAFDNPALPPQLKARRKEALGRQWMVIAGCYFEQRQYGNFLRCAWQSLKQNPARICYLLAFPLRRWRAVQQKVKSE